MNGLMAATNLTYQRRKGNSSQCFLQHILLHCVDFQNSRDKYYKVNTLKELFETIEINNIFRFLKEIGLFYKI